MLPDVVSDAAIKAAKNMGCEFMETFFYRSALEAGFASRAEDEARRLMKIWARQGFDTLPLWVKNYARLQAGQKQLFSNVPIKQTA